MKVVDLSFTHLGQTQPTIQNVNLTLNPGELVVLAGTTGSGKSTLLNCLTGIAPEHMGGKLSGQVFCRGEEITAWSIRMRSQLMGILLQNVEAQIFTDQVWEELVFGLENWNLPPGEIQDLAQSALTEFDLVEQRDWTIHQLSAGQKQRLLLACLLTRQPDMLLLDEPFAFLDTAGVQLLLELLKKRVAQGQAVLLIEHRLELLRESCDRIYNIESGQVSLLASPLPVPTQTRAEPPPHTSKKDKPVVLKTENLSWGGYPPFPDLQVMAGDIVLLKGENGCGKTTLLKLLSGLLKPSTGQLEILGRDVTRQSVVTISRSLGFVLQNPNHQLFAESVEAEVTQSRVEPEQAKRLLKALNLSHCIQKHPHALSQGQKRRLALGAVLVREPKICLLDEIMVGQDPASLGLMLEALKTFTEKGGVLIFTSHDPGIATVLQPQVLVLH
ncbi:MAG: ATP-binding cassette domain-containing protein [Cyanobacteria bacterium P01_A01_bin.17]